MLKWTYNRQIVQKTKGYDILEGALCLQESSMLSASKNAGKASMSKMT